MDDLLAGWDRLEAQVEDVLTSIDQAVTVIHDVQSSQGRLEGHKAQIQTTWTAWNQRQYHELQRKLKAVADAEMRRREHAQDQADEYKRRKDHIQRQKKLAAAGKKVEKLPPPKGLSWDEVAEILSPEKFIAERDELVGTWIANLLQQTMANRPAPVWEWAHDISISTGTAAKTALSNDDDDEMTTDNDTEQGCLTLLDAVVHIQQALTNYSHEDGLGMADHARGGRIVHHATSPTYHPAEPSTETWGNSKWRNYVIPQEVEEYILVHIDGWEDWPIWPTNYLPHSLARWAPGSHTTAPPETVLQGATWPGACWPMEGDSGEITIALPYPIHPTAVSIDHVSRLLLTGDDEERDTAPKTMRVWGYAPCEDGDDCQGLEYDEEDVYDLFRGRTIAYDLNGASVQTFWLPKPKSPKVEDEDADPASCTAPEDDEDEEAMMASCSGDFSVVEPDTLVRAIKIEVIDNWGNSDFTCLYRARVHGNPSA
eukprot:scaffold3586_cov164-Amphora_coffeaeformis.AAC.14